MTVFCSHTASRRSSRSLTTTWRWTRWIHWASRPHRAEHRQVNTGKPRDPLFQWCWTRLLLLAWKKGKIIILICWPPVSVLFSLTCFLCVSPVCFLLVSSAVLQFVSRLSGAFSRWRSWRLGLKANSARSSQMYHATKRALPLCQFTAQHCSTHDPPGSCPKTDDSAGFDHSPLSLFI